VLFLIQKQVLGVAVIVQIETMAIKSWIFSEGDTESLMVTNNGDGLESLRKAQNDGGLMVSVTI